MTLATYITLTRLVITPFIWVFYNMGHAQTATILFIAAAITDAIDGYVARKYAQVSNAGKLLDPIADKVLILSVLWLLINSGFVPYWLALLLITKEIMLVIGGAILLSRQHVVKARIWGKAGSFFLFIALSAGLAGLIILRPLLFVGATLSLIAGIDYLLLALRLSQGSNA
jgi:cardiolipin synthase